MTLVPDNAIVGGFRIAHGSHGEGEPLVLIHGTPSSSHIWRNVLPSLVDAGYKVHTLDLLGFGRSERPLDLNVDTSVSGQVDVVIGLMDEWGLGSANVVAHDIGGSVALRIAAFHPGRVRSLTVADPCTFDSWPSPRTKQQMADGLDKLIAAPPTSIARTSRSGSCPPSSTPPDCELRHSTTTSIRSPVRSDRRACSSTRSAIATRGTQRN